MTIATVVIPQPRRSCHRHSKRMAYCDDCNMREPVKSK